MKLLKLAVVTMAGLWAASVVLPRDDSWRAAEPARVATPVANKPVAHKTETPHDQTSGSSPTAQPDPYAETDRRQVEANYKAELENFQVLARYAFYASACHVLPDHAMAIAVLTDPLHLLAEIARVSHITNLGSSLDQLARDGHAVAVQSGYGYWKDHPNEAYAMRQRELH
jgi:hypothetical protein